MKGLWLMSALKTEYSSRFGDIPEALRGPFADALDAIAKQARAIGPSHQSAISYVPDGNFKVAAHATSLSEKYAKYREYDVHPTGEGIWGIIFKLGRPVRMTDGELTSHPAWKAFSGLKTDKGLEHPPMRGWLAVPIQRQDGEVIGLVQLTDRESGDYTPKDEELLCQFAQLVAPTFELEYVRSELQEREKAQALQNKELERMNSAKDRFLASMSHELRTPLNAIIGYSGTLLMKLAGPLNKDQESQLGIIKDSARHLLSLINDILDLAKIESGKVELNLEPINCNTILGDVAATLKHMSMERLLDLQVEAPGTDITIRTDKRALTQVLINLVTNAIKFTEVGGVTLSIGDTLLHGKEFIQIHVEDTGIGIAEQEQAKLFNAFQQAGNPAHRPEEGTGLGLYVSQKLAHLLGGEITFSSKPGKGSCFTLSLPS